MTMNKKVVLLVVVIINILTLSLLYFRLHVRHSNSEVMCQTHEAIGAFASNMGIGNQLFIYSSLYCLGRTQNFSTFIEAGSPFILRNLFPNLSIQTRKSTGKLKTVLVGGGWNGKCCTYDVKSRNIPKQCHMILYGYMQSWKYFEPCKKQLFSQVCARNNTYYTEHFNYRNSIAGSVKTLPAFAKSIGPRGSTVDSPCIAQNSKNSC